jgi:hypothetical protein
MKVAAASSTLLSRETQKVLKGVLPANQSFPDGKGSFGCRSTNSSYFKEHMYLSKEIICVEAEASSTLFLCDN